MARVEQAPRSQTRKAKTEKTGRHSLSQLIDFRERQRLLFEYPHMFPDVDFKTLAQISDRALSRIALDISETGIDPKVLADLMPKKKGLQKEPVR